MFLKVVFLVTVLFGTIEPLVAQGGGKVVGRIYRGTNAVGINYPWMVSIGRQGAHWCGGSILSARNILTAAHCIYEQDEEQLTVRVGSKYKSSGGQLFRVKKAFYHANFNQAISLDYDIGVIRLSGNIPFSNEVYPVALPKQGEKVQEGTHAALVGWGETEQGNTEFLQHAVVKIISEDTCRRLYTGYRYTDRMLCAGYLNAGIDHCGGDSGGALVVNETVVGIVSYTAGHGCGIPHEAGVYTRVSALVDWIRNYLRRFGK